MDFVFPTDNQVKIKESEKIDNYLDLAKEQKKNQQLWNMRVMVILIVLERSPEALKGARRSWKSEDELRLPDYSIVEISQNTEKSPGDPRRLFLT